MKKNILNNYSDEELFGAIQAGNCQAFEVLYSRYAQRLKHYFFRMLNNDAALAEDFLQELMLKIVHKQTGFDTTRSFKTWIFSIAHNQCKNHYRHLNVVQKHEQESHYENNSYTTQLSEIVSLDEKMIRSLIESALLKLSVEKREVVLLRFQEEKSIAEIAQITDISEGTVKSRLHYALQQLAQLLKDHKQSLL